MMDDLARRAAAQWEGDVASLALAAHRENAVYHLCLADGRAFALRLHRNGYRSTAELQSELDYMAALAEGGLAVPQPMPSRVGRIVETVEGTQVSMLSWLSGTPLGQTGAPLNLPDRLGSFDRLGRLIARLHDLSDAWKPPRGFVRQPWDIEGLLGDNPQWGRFWANPHLSAGEADLLQQVRAKLRATLESRAFDTGLIHADCVSENIMCDGPVLHLIDFDDSGPGFRLQDLATALVKHQKEPDYLQLRAAVVAGYRKTRAVDDRDIDLFLLMRHLSYVGWIVPRLSNAGGEARSRRFIADVLPMARAFLQG